ncbi:gluconolactonase [Mucilaginibacter sp. PPCGB 2223]|uniref:SMP-30/gluconolactonase/LRE family protein n=1 Tax=Mucilaginibacter sp. PPCGB 2223 TaxID=1886027 RepID=UPI0008266EDD|nr:SMP-30/gluconolactonase/LRE family protein [Mucilaginibacter sp. PPCGB 2223]OCX52643.1 gluconolactonase [Mucilaginibacter sp. PPCGB 2223]
MRNLLVILLCFLPIICFSQTPAEKYPVDSASVEHPGVPKGEILKFTFADSKIFPGTWREYMVYVPAQYDPAKPACVFVDQDGIQFKSPTVFDNLIHSKEMPVTIGVYITPGRVLAKDTTALDRYNRSLEFDGLGDAYARFVLDELLPDVEKHKTTNGRAIVLSHNGNDRMIAGTSSGAIAAFTAAWERPDAFSRVMSGIGTYVSLRGGDRYPGLIRKYEPKPIRIFLQDGSHDLNIYGGDWFYANQMMERAFTFAGYEVNHAWGEGAHSGAQSTALFADAMRWLWKDYPAPVKAGKSKNAMLGEILIDREGWEKVSGDYGLLSEFKADREGEICLRDIKTNKWYTIDHDNRIKVERHPKPKVLKSDASPHGMKSLVVVAFNKDAEIDYYKYPFSGNDLVNNNFMYLTGTTGSVDGGKILMFKDYSKKLVVDRGLNHPYGLALTPDHSQLYVTESNTHWIWIYNINADGTLSNKQRYGWLHSPDTTDNAQPRGIKVDRDGRVYVATALGIQVLDQVGRVNAILPLPFGAGPAIDLCFGGKDFNELFVITRDKIYRRKLNVHGMNDFDPPVKPAKPHL